MATTKTPAKRTRTTKSAEPTEATLTLTHTKTTKGTYVYTDDAENAPIPSVYIKKHQFGETAPETLTVTLSW